MEYLLMTPGPVRIPDELLQQLAQPMIHHRTQSFEDTLNRVLDKLKALFRTEEHVYIHTSTGSGAMESAIVNTLSVGDEVLVVTGGKFGERWAELCEAFGLKVNRLDVPWGEAVDPNSIQLELDRNQQIKAVLCQACETSTAVLHPIREIAEIIKDRSNTLLMVDAITALGVTDLPMDSWGLDVVIGGSQKTFMLPTGLSFISLSRKAQAFIKTSNLPKYYFDLKRELKANQTGQTFFSSPVTMIRALESALDLIIRKGLDNQIREFRALSRGLVAAGEVMGLATFSKAPSPSVTAFLTPMDSEKLRVHLESKYNLTIMGGQDELKGKIIRIGTLGAVTTIQVQETIKRLHLALSDFGLDSDLQKALNAFQTVYEKN